MNGKQWEQIVFLRFEKLVKNMGEILKIIQNLKKENVLQTKKRNFVGYWLGKTYMVKKKGNFVGTIDYKN